MKKALQFLNGKKTYIITFAAAVYAALIGLGVVPSVEFVWQLMGAGALATLRSGMPKAAAQ